MNTILYLTVPFMAVVFLIFIGVIVFQDKRREKESDEELKQITAAVAEHSQKVDQFIARIKDEEYKRNGS